MVLPLPRFNRAAFPIVNPDRFRDRDIGEPISRDISGIFETLARADQFKKQNQRQDELLNLRKREFESEFGTGVSPQKQADFGSQAGLRGGLPGANQGLGLVDRFNQFQQQRAAPQPGGIQQFRQDPFKFREQFGRRGFQDAAMIEEMRRRANQLPEQPKAPQGFRFIEGGQRLEPIPGGPAELDIREKERKVSEEKEIESRKLRNTLIKTENVLERVDKALTQVGPTSTGLGSVIGRQIPGSAFKNLTSTLNTIRASLAFKTLQDMREASKTGGALGQVSERELGLLESALAALDQDQSPSQLRENLFIVKEHYTNARNALLEIQKRGGDVPLGTDVSQFSSGREVQPPDVETRFNQLRSLGASEQEAYTRLAEEGYR